MYRGTDLRTLQPKDCSEFTMVWYRRRIEQALDVLYSGTVLYSGLTDNDAVTAVMPTKVHI